MNEGSETLAAAMVAARFADEDEARARWLADKMLAERVDEVEIPGTRRLCKRGHNDWWTNAKGVRRCRTCHRERMAEARDKGRSA